MVSKKGNSNLIICIVHLLWKQIYVLILVTVETEDFRSFHESMMFDWACINGHYCCTFFILLFVTLKLSVAADLHDDSHSHTSHSHTTSSNNNGHSLALSDVNVLLPLSSSSSKNNLGIKYKITAQGGASNGCVEWRVDDDSIVSIEPLSPQLLDGQCTEPESATHSHACPYGTSSALLITAISQVEQRVSTLIHAYDPKSGDSAECNVFVDQVHRLEIATSTRLIYLSKYESIRVLGFDKDGNKFDTLEGYVTSYVDFFDCVCEYSMDIFVAALILHLFCILNNLF